MMDLIPIKNLNENDIIKLHWYSFKLKIISIVFNNAQLQQNQHAKIKVVRLIDNKKFEGTFELYEKTANYNLHNHVWLISNYGKEKKNKFFKIEDEE